MKIIDWLKFFEENREIKVFHIKHLQLLTQMSVISLRTSLYRLVKKKIVKRICRGYYANPVNIPTLEEIATLIYYPAYISLESALSYWGVLSQMPQVLTMVTIKLPFRINTEFGRIEYRQIKKDYFWGFIKKNNFFIAEPEKAFLDYIYLYKNPDLSELDLTVLEKKKVKDYAKKMALNKEILKKIF